MALFYSIFKINLCAILGFLAGVLERAFLHWVEDWTDTFYISFFNSKKYDCLWKKGGKSK